MNSNIIKAFAVLSMTVGLWGCGNGESRTTETQSVADERNETVSQDVAIKPPASPADSRPDVAAEQQDEAKAGNDSQEMVIDEKEADAEVNADTTAGKPMEDPAADAGAATMTSQEMQPVIVDAEGVKLNSIILARGVDKREPIEPGTQFTMADGEKIYAIMDVSNTTEVATELTVSWKMPGSDKEIGKTALEAKAAKTWRTWSFTRYAKKAGRWEAIVRNAEGNIIARAPFEILE